MYKDFSYINGHKEDVGAIKQSITNIILTRKGSVPGIPHFGSDIYKLVFEPIDPLTEKLLKNYIFEAIQEFEDRVLVDSITIKEVPEYNRLVINLRFFYIDVDTGEYLQDDASIAVSLI